MSTDSEAVLKFKEYFLDHANFRLNENFENTPDKNFDVDFDIESTIIVGDRKSSVQLNAIVGEEDNKDCPFIIEVGLIGLFEFEGDPQEYKSFLVENAVAVIFPYLRSVISEMSVKSNLFPNYLLPLMNISRYLLDNEKVNIINEKDIPEE